MGKIKSKKAGSGIAVNEPGVHNEFYGITQQQFDTLPAAQRDTHRDAAKAVDDLRRNTVSILANGVAADFRAGGATSLIGKEIGSPYDLAAAAQVYRNPLFETFNSERPRVLHTTDDLTAYWEERV